MRFCPKNAPKMLKNRENAPKFPQFTENAPKIAKVLWQC